MLYNLQRVPSRTKYQLEGPKAKCTSERVVVLHVELASSSSLGGVGGSSFSLDMTVDVESVGCGVVIYHRRCLNAACRCFG
jgi:hypothetical protein